MIYYQDLDAEMKKIERALGGLRHKAPSVLASSLDSTARIIRDKLVDKTNADYQNKAKVKKKDLTLFRAQRSKLIAKLVSKGEVKDLMEYKVNPVKVTNQYKRTKPSSYNAQVLRSGGLKALDGSPKPFITQFASGHKALVVRVPGKRMSSNPKKEFIKKLLGPSIPKQFENERNLEVARKIHAEELSKQISKRVSDILAKQGGRPS